ncbi:MAG: Ig-like domain-containing protein [Cyclobacteriaceae bacterium]
MGGTIGTSPTIQFLNPSSTIDVNSWEGENIEVTAVDEDGTIESVTLLTNGEPFGLDSVAPYMFENIRNELWLLSNDIHAITALATDNEGNTRASRLRVISHKQEPINLNDYEARELCSAHATSFQNEARPSNTIDGNLADESRWSSEDYGAQLTIAACEAKHTDAIGIKWYRGNKRRAFFDLEVSLDSSTWRTIYSGASSGTSVAQEGFLVGGDSIKYLRYTGFSNSDSRW